MAQKLRPDSDVSNTGGWSASFGINPLYSEIDETSASDSDEISCPVTTGTAACEVGLSNAIDPNLSTGHILRIRANYSVQSHDLKVTLKESGTPRATTTISLNNVSPTNYTYTLSSGEANSITNYSNLTVEFEKQSSGSAARSFVTWFEFEIPDAGTAHLDISSGGLAVVANASGNYLIRSGGGYQRVTAVEVAGALILASGQIKEWNGIP